MNIADISVRYSGGATNADQAASLGGIISSNSPSMQSSSASTISGVTISEVGGMLDGQARLTVDVISGTLSFLPPGSYSGPEVTYLGNGNASYVLYGAEGPTKGYILVDIVESSLPAGTTSELLDITTTAEGIIPDVTYAQATTGITQYRCLYLKNVDASISIIDLGLYLLRNTAGEDSISYALDTDAGVGNGSTTGVAVTLADENDSTNLLLGLTFDNETDHTLAQMLGTPIVAGNSIAIWIKRVVPAYVDVEVLDNDFSLGIKAYIGG